MAEPLHTETLVAPQSHVDGNGHSHAHDPNLAHHFEDLGQQHESLNLGMWVFLATEVMFFGGLIGSYMVYRFTTPEIWGAASRHLNVWLGTFNTVILLSSSLAMALAVHAGETGERKKQVRYLLATIFLGTAFLGVKGIEYYQEYTESLIPGPGFSIEALKLTPSDAESVETRRQESVLTIGPDEFRNRRAQLFFVFYFAMTGLHAVHMIIGLVLLAIMTEKARRGQFTASYHTPLEVSGLYWHFIDIVWVFLYPLLYLVSLHSSHTH